MKQSRLLKLMKHYGVKFPDTGTGVNGRVINRDLESALGDHFLTDIEDPAELTHMNLRRTVVPMKAYRFDKLPDERKKHVMESDNWFAEEKVDGWRMLLTYIPGYGMRAYGGNISTANFLPIDYTNHILIDNKKLTQIKFHQSIPFVLDCEAYTTDYVNTLGGQLTYGTLDGIGALLGCDSARAIKLQKEDSVKVKIKAFDTIQDGIDSYSARAFTTKFIVQEINNLNFYGNQLTTVQRTRENKKDFLKRLWAEGKEGIILKNIHSPYKNGARDQYTAIKVKRAMSGEIGDDIDAYIGGFIYTPEWSKLKLVGGVQLYVLCNDEPHHIATVTSMPDEIRKAITEDKKSFYKKVVVVDGQDLSTRNKRLMHAKVDWARGFRQDKRAEDCTFAMDVVEETKF